MNKIARLIAAAGVALTAPLAAQAEETVRWLHLEVNPAQVAIWTEAAHQFESAHPGVTVALQYIENEAFKAKLTTMLQSRDKPSMFYSWSGGVLKAQVAAGVLQDITPETRGYVDQLNPAAVGPFTVDGKLYGIPQALSTVGFIYNKDLFRKANVDAAGIKTWDDLLAAVKALKAAGITPLTAGGGDKWPLALYYSALSLREGGKAAIDAAMANKDGGFNAPPFVKAGADFKQLVDLQPFQPGMLGSKYLPAVGLFADGKVAMSLVISTFYAQQKAIAADKKGLSAEQLGWIDFPAVAGGKGQASDTLGGIVGWVVSKGAPAPTVEFIKSFVSPQYQSKLAAAGYIVPVVRSADAAITDPFIRHLADQLEHSTYHQNFYDQTLGPSVGRTVNDAVAEIAGGSMTPEQAAASIQSAWEQGN
jgi:raffinose/stachyose/melibiose transport system substrate-binding protein